MNVVIFGATGMIGQGVLRQCLLDPAVTRVLVVTRRATGVSNPRLEEVVVPDVADLSSVESRLSGLDACFFCLGVSAAGMSEERYTALTYDLTLAVARTLARVSPRMAFIYVSGMGTDSSERGRSMWARVKGRTENALLRLPFRAAYMFRPAFILPQHGIRSRTPLYRAAYALFRPFYPFLRVFARSYVTTTDQISRAMLAVARDGYPRPILEARDLKTF